MDQDGEAHSELYGVRWRRRDLVFVAFLLSVGFFMMNPVVLCLCDHTAFGNAHRIGIEFGFAFSTVGAIFVSALAFKSWPCPRCGKAFNASTAGLYSEHRRCSNCGLRRPDMFVWLRGSP